MIIGISGKAQTGKDTVADYICKNYLFYKKRFADKLKEIVAKLIGCSLRDLENAEFKEKGLGEEWTVWYLRCTEPGEENIILSPLFGTSEELLYFIENKRFRSYRVIKEELTPRKVLQLLGTEGGRKILHPNIWIISTLKEYYSYSNWVISDVRFTNEAQAIKERGGYLIRLNRRTATVLNNSNHASEIDLDGYEEFDTVINNDFSIDDLYKEVDKIMNKLGIKKKVNDNGENSNLPL